MVYVAQTKTGRKHSLAWQDKALCNGSPLADKLWDMLDHKNQIATCLACPVRAICRQYNDDMQSSGIVAGGRWYPVTTHGRH